MLTVGEKFLRYKVLSFIGGGGMGEVYLAKDQQLERKIAIKVLGKKFGHLNDNSLERFVQEARAASALNHPNIITIYEIGEHDGSPYIASEFIEGITLHDKLARRALTVPEILNIAIQIAEALTAAHTAGIIHRDIKPENIMIREDGYVKVLDFGLAKLTEDPRRSVEAEADTKQMMVTDPGIILGTVSYMSPEQTRGKSIDARTDIWSLGVVIYEMLSGRRPFTGESSSDVIAAILKSDPPPMTTGDTNGIPGSLERIVNRTLRKDREERYQHIKDLLIDLKDFRRDHDSSKFTDSGMLHQTDGNAGGGSTGDTAPPGKTTDPLRATTRSIKESLVTQFRLRPLLSGLLLAATLAAVVVGGVALARMIRRTGELGAFQSMRFTRLTSSGNLEGGLVAISKDGRYVAYVVNDGGKQSLWVRQATGDGNAQVIPSADTDYSGITFSNDGNYIFCTANVNGRSSVYSVTTLGGTPRTIIENATGPISISADGSRIAFVRGGREIIVTAQDGSNSRTISTAEGSDAYNFAVWSDDNSIFAAAYFAADNRLHLLKISASDGSSSEPFKRSWLFVNGISILPDNGDILLVARDTDTLYSQIWLLGQASGNISRITNDISNYKGLSVGEDGKTLVTIKEDKLINIWTADGSRPDNARRVTTEVGREEGLSGIAWTPSGKILYTARIPAMQDIWVVDPSDGTNRQLTFNVGSNYSPTVSPDGRTIVFISDRSGNVNLWKMGIDGQDPVQLTDTPGNEGQPAFTRDGRFILYYYVDDKRQISVWKVPVEGGEPTRLTGPGVSRPNVSPDGTTFACRYGVGNGPASKIGIFPIEGGQPIKVLDLPEVAASHTFRWATDGTSFIYIDTKSGFDLYNQPIDYGPAKLLVPSGTDTIYTFDISGNGKSLALSRGSETSDAVIIRNLKL